MMLHGFSQNLMGRMLPVALDVMIAATAVVAFRTGFLPRWSVWVSGIIALGSFSPVAYILGAAAILWIAVMSLVLYTRGRQQAAV